MYSDLNNLVISPISPFDINLWSIDLIGVISDAVPEKKTSSELHNSSDEKLFTMTFNTTMENMMVNLLCLW